ncbi:hypothetical protein TNCV_105911 [Trichonephila clavipes]|nr:hypothetical protein TNCV_105911 [Trichonephila clavipes]
MAREARQHELELRKLELSQQNQPLNDESGRRFEIGPLIQLTQITTKFDEKHDEISLYLINFERKAELAHKSYIEEVQVEQRKVEAMFLQTSKISREVLEELCS